MKNTVWEWLEQAGTSWPEKTAYRMETEQGVDAVSFAQLFRTSRLIAGMLTGDLGRSCGSPTGDAHLQTGCPQHTEDLPSAAPADQMVRPQGLPPQDTCTPPLTVVFADKSIAALLLIWGVIASGRAYAPLDPSLPAERIRRILETVRPEAVLADVRLTERIETLKTGGALSGRVQFFDTNALREAAAHPERVQTEGTAELSAESFSESSAETSPESCREASAFPEGMRLENAAGCDPASGQERMASDRPLYCIFTSGSTGTPKGVLTSQASLVNYIEGYGAMMDIGPEDVLGNQSPLDYIAAIRDIYLPVRFGCTCVLLDKRLFLQPARLFASMDRQGVTAAGWSASALGVIAGMRGLAEGGPRQLRKVCFSGSVLPSAVLRQWQEACPGAAFVNQYGPTEATASCTYHRLDHRVEEDEVIPIGKPFPGYDVFLLAEDDFGEICVGGIGVTMGYYADPERTAASFGERTLPDGSVQRIYRTGDLGRRDADGVFYFLGRKDRQIKHMGHRVEPEEIERAAAALPDVAEAAVIYHAQKEQLVLFYTGTAPVREVATGLRKVLPGFMIPRKLVPSDALPRLANGKVDYRELRGRVLLDEPKKRMYKS